MAGPRVRFHYIKSNAFRVIHVDGVIGGPTPNGNLHASFFNERAPVPTMAEYELSPVSENSAQLGKQIGRAGKDGFVREVEVGVMMNLDMAKKLHAWLGEQIASMTEPEEKADGS